VILKESIFLSLEQPNHLKTCSFQTLFLVTMHSNYQVELMMILNEIPGF